MSHLKGYIHERKLDVRSYAVEQRIKFTRGLPDDVENSGKPGASCDLLETHVIIDSDEAPDVIRSCIEDAQAVCMATVALINPVPAVTYIRLKGEERSEEHTSELQSLMRISYAVFCLKKKKNIDRLN